MSSDKFNVVILLESLRETIVKDDVLIDQYCKSFEELSKLLPLFGKIFVFVSSDVREKLGILCEHRSSNDSKKYLTVSSMAEFEVSTGRLKQKGHLPNGCRTLLRLHRAMRFLEDLCRRLVLSDELLTGKTLRAPRLALATQSITTSDDNLVPQTSPYFEPQPANYPPIAVSVSPGEHLSSMVRTAYDAHLSEHHTWAVRKAVQFAVYVLPSRESLVRQIIEVHAGTCLPAGLLFDELPSATTAGVHIADGQTEKPAFEDGLLNSTSNSSPPTEHVQSKSSTSSPSQITEADVLPMMLLTCDLLAEIYGRVQRIFERHQLLNLP